MSDELPPLLLRRYHSCEECLNLDTLERVVTDIYDTHIFVTDILHSDEGCERHNQLLRMLNYFIQEQDEYVNPRLGEVIHEFLDDLLNQSLLDECITLIREDYIMRNDIEIEHIMEEQERIVKYYLLTKNKLERFYHYQYTIESALKHIFDEYSIDDPYIKRLVCIYIDKRCSEIILSRPGP